MTTHWQWNLQEPVWRACVRCFGVFDGIVGAYLMLEQRLKMVFSRSMASSHNISLWLMCCY